MDQQLSLTQYPLKLQAVYDDQTLAHATGLLCCPSGRTTLVTNWHVVSGKDAFTGKHLDKYKRMPTSLRVSVALCEVERKIGRDNTEWKQGDRAANSSSAVLRHRCSAIRRRRSKMERASDVGQDFVMWSHWTSTQNIAPS